jgi:hypothetical protein
MNTETYEAYEILKSGAWVDKGNIDTNIIFGLIRNHGAVLEADVEWKKPRGRPSIFKIGAYPIRGRNNWRGVRLVSLERPVFPTHAETISHVLKTPEVNARIRKALKTEARAALCRRISKDPQVREKLRLAMLRRRADPNFKYPHEIRRERKTVGADLGGS